MEQKESRRFYRMVFAIAILWACLSLFAMPSLKQKTQVAAQKVSFWVQEIAALYGDNLILADDQLLELEQVNKQCRQTLQEQVIHLGYRGDEKNSPSVVVFRSHLNQKILALRSKCNQMAVGLDDTLGFSQTIAATQFHNGYWVALDLGGQLIEMLLALDGGERLLQNISKLGYPGLTTPPAAQTFIAEFPVEFTCETKPSFVMKLIAQCSLLKNKTSDVAVANGFWKIVQITMEQMPAKNDGTVIAKISLSVLQINEQGEVTATVKDTTNLPPKITPIWEHY